MQIRIKDVAKATRGWSLYRLAKELNLPQQTVYSWASGRTQPSYIHMELLCSALECTMNDLFVPEPFQQRLL
jgi:transcriptional regulator with XRE-family HTH domain